MDYELWITRGVFFAVVVLEIAVVWFSLKFAARVVSGVWDWAFPNWDQWWCKHTDTNIEWFGEGESYRAVRICLLCGTALEREFSEPLAVPQTPTDPNDVVNKSYVDSVCRGLHWLPIYPMAGPPVTGRFDEGDCLLDSEDLGWVCNKAGTPGEWIQFSGPANHRFVVRDFDDLIEEATEPVSGIAQFQDFDGHSLGPALSTLAVGGILGVDVNDDAVTHIELPPEVKPHLMKLNISIIPGEPGSTAEIRMRVEGGDLRDVLKDTGAVEGLRRLSKAASNASEATRRFGNKVEQGPLEALREMGDA